MKVPEKCQECMAKGIFPCNDCMLSGIISKEIAELFEIQKEEGDHPNWNAISPIHDTS